jgi:hypothetical protein
VFADGDHFAQSVKVYPSVRFDKGARAFCFFCALTYAALFVALAVLALTILQF